MDIFICQYCASEKISKKSLIGHEIYCKNNPNRKMNTDNTGRKQNRKAVAIEIFETGVYCSYGCGNSAKYKNKSGNYMCEISPNKCAENKKKNTKGCKKAYYSGKRIDPTDQYKNLTEETKERMAWAKGLTKETDERVRKFGETLSENIAKGIIQPSFLGRTHTIETKKKLSLKRTEFLENNSKHCEWYEVAGIKVQGTLEKSFAEFLFVNNIPFERIRLRFQNHRTYTPDFYIPKFDIFVETKGFLYEKDKEKMRLALLENDIDLRLAFLKDIDNLCFETDLIKLPKANSFLENIDYSKFENHWGR